MLKLSLHILRMRRFLSPPLLKFSINNARLPEKEFSDEEELFEAEYHNHLQEEATKRIMQIKNKGKSDVNLQAFLSKVNISTTSIQNLAKIIEYRLKVEKYSEDFDLLRAAITARLSQFVADENLSSEQMLILHSCYAQMTRKDYSFLCRIIYDDLEHWSISQLILLVRQINCKRGKGFIVYLHDINEVRLFDKLLPRFLKEKPKLFDLILLYDVFEFFFNCSISKRLLIHTTLSKIDDFEMYLFQQINRATNIDEIMSEMFFFKAKVGGKLMRSILRHKFSSQQLAEASSGRLKLGKDEELMYLLQNNFEPGNGLKDWIRYFQIYINTQKGTFRAKNCLTFIKVLMKLSRSNKELRKYFIENANEAMKNIRRFKIEDLIYLERMRVDVFPIFNILNIDEFESERINPISYLVLLERQMLVHPDGTLDDFVEYAYKMVARKFRHLNTESSLDYEREYSFTNNDEPYEKLFDIEYFPRLELLLSNLPNPFEPESDFTDSFKSFYCSVFRYMGPAQKQNTLKSLYKNIDIDTVLLFFQQYCFYHMSLSKELILTLIEFTEDYLRDRNLPQTESLQVFQQMSYFLISTIKKFPNFQKQMKNSGQILAIMDYCLKFIDFAARNLDNKTNPFLENLIVFLWTRQGKMDTLEIFWRILDKLNEHFDVLWEGEAKMYLEEMFQKKAFFGRNLLDRKEEFEKALVALGGNAYTGFGIVNVAWIQFEPYINQHWDQVANRINSLKLSQVEQLIIAFRLPLTPTSSQVLNALCLRGEALIKTKKETTSNFMPFGRLLRKLLIFADQAPVKQYVRLLLQDEYYQQYTELVDNKCLCETIAMLKRFGMGETKECKKLQIKSKGRKEYVLTKELIRTEIIK